MKCCNNQCLHKARLWGMRIFPMKACCKCSEVTAKWPLLMEPIFAVLALANGLILNADEWAIETEDSYKEHGGI